MARTQGVRHLREIPEAESLRLLASVPFGRVVFSRNALPAIRPVNHVVDGRAVIIRTHLGAAVLSRDGQVVAYEADSLDPLTHLGWSVIVTGVARLVADPDQVKLFQRLLRPWVDGAQKDQVIRIGAEIVTGYSLVDDRESTPN
ncbi:MAG TPA: pyridoxamine 5'-phosphate oxidase family protein [Aldersonia sp.]